MLALPFVLLFLAFTLGPVLASLGMSFTDMKRTDMRNPFAVQFVGLANYTDLLADPLFRKVTLNTLLYLVLGVPLTMAVALAVAVGVNRMFHAKGFFRVGLLPPGGDQHRGRLGRLEVPATATTAGSSTPCSAGSASTAPGGSTAPRWRCRPWS